MELDESYNLQSFELEKAVREAYGQGIRKFRKSDDPQECL